MLVLYFVFPFLTSSPLSFGGGSIFHPTPLCSTRPTCSIQLLSTQIRIRLWFRCCLWRPFLRPLQVYAGLFPSPLRHPCSQPPSGPLTEVQNWSRHNILCDRVLPPCDWFPDPLEACLPHCLIQWWVGPTNIPLSPRLPPGEPSCNPVLESIQGLLHKRGKHPHLRPKQQYRLRH